MRVQAAEQFRFVERGEEKQAPALQQAREIARFHCRAQQAQIGFEDAEDRFVARGVKERFDVISKAEPQDEERGLVDRIDCRNEFSGFRNRIESAVKIDSSPLGSGHGNCREPGFCQLGRVAARLGQRLDLCGQPGIIHPQRSKIRQVGGVLWKDESS